MACSRIIDDPIFSSSLDLRPPEIPSHLNCDSFELQFWVHLKRWGLVEFTETWRNSSHDRSAMVDGYINSGKVRLQMRGRSYNLCAKVWLVILSWLPGAHKDTHFYSSGKGGEIELKRTYGSRGQRYHSQITAKDKTDLAWARWVWLPAVVTE